MRHTRVVTGLCLALTLPLSGAAAVAAEAPGQQPSGAQQTALRPQLPPHLHRIRALRSLLGTHHWYRQTAQGFPVVDGLYAVHLEDDGRRSVYDGRRDVRGLVVPARPIGARRAVAAVDSPLSRAPRATVRDAGLWVLPGRDGAPARLVRRVHTMGPGKSTLTYVDAASRAVVRTVVVSHSSDERRRGRGRVFVNNPVVETQNQDLTDRKDARAAVPRKAYTRLTLRNLDRSGKLRGRWVRITNKRTPVRPRGRYMFFRDQGFFEQVEAYWALNAQQEFYRRLGFKHINAEAQKIATNAFSEDNSYYDPTNDQIAMGSGGVDDAEDPEVLWHENGHATQDAQVPGFGMSNQAGAIGEGFGDYIGGVMARGYHRPTAVTPGVCVMDWDATSYTSTEPHCLRRMDTTKRFPEDMGQGVHADGEIWSTALWRLNNTLGRRRAATVILESQFRYTPRIGFVAAAKLAVRASRRLYGDKAAVITRRAFHSRGIL